MKKMWVIYMAAWAGITSTCFSMSLDDRMVQVIVTYQAHNELMPWQDKNPLMRYGYGIQVDKSHVITTESLTRNHKFIELRKARTGEKVSATVEMSDSQINLAILNVPNGWADSEMPTIQFSDKTPPNTEVKILQFDETQQLQSGNAKVVNVSMAPLPDAPYSSLTVSLLATLDINGDGAGVVLDEKLAGLIMYYDRSTRTGSMIPASVIQQFLNKCNDAQYPGFASAGFIWAPLIDPVKRNFLDVKQTDQGILVLACLPNTDAENALKPDDVIIAWDNANIDNLGFYEDADFGRMNIAYLIKGRRNPGDTIPVKIIRDKQETTVNLTLCYRADDENLIPENVEGKRSEYIVEGGFIIRELTGSYLRANGSSWQQTFNPRLVHMYFIKRSSPAFTGERIVILAGVIPDPINVGYQHLDNLMITRINGENVKNMHDVFAIIKRDGHITQVSLASIEIDLVLDNASLPSANRRICENYRIPTLQYKDND